MDNLRLSLALLQSPALFFVNQCVQTLACCRSNCPRSGAFVLPLFSSELFEAPGQSR